MGDADFRILEGDIPTVVALSLELPEFYNPYGKEELTARLSNAPHLILIAYQVDVPIAFKVGYERDGYFYSWLGGVLPPFRRMGIAKALAEHQEQWAKNKGYEHITLKTRNRFKNMLKFALGRGFEIIDFNPHTPNAESRIWLRKKI